VGLLALDSRVGIGVAVAGGLAIFGLLLLLTSAGELRGRRKARVPVGFRPGPSDEELEHSVLERTLLWAGVTTIFIAIFLPAYWLREPHRLAGKKAFIATETVREGMLLFEGNPDGEPPTVGLCVQCHGVGGAGGSRQYLVDGKQLNYAEPPLKYVYSRYLQAGRNQDEITQLLYDAINRGRPGTPMPTWGLAFGGPLNSRQVDTVVAYLQSLQIEFPKPATTDAQELYKANCAICHNAPGADDPLDKKFLAKGGIGPNLTIELQRHEAFCAQGKICSEDVFDIIKKGRLNTNRPSMPAWAGLGDDAIRALVEFIQSIQVVKQ
jgi:mono/diheme cytochrome c family protein